jgi:aldehyde dehydrogenase (NAD+)/aldehyde dehydrogenase
MKEVSLNMTKYIKHRFTRAYWGCWRNHSLNFPMLMLAWKVAPALATGCTAVVKPAEQTPTSVIMLMELIGDILPAGVLNIVTGFGAEAGQALATSKRIAKLSFTGSTETGRKVYHNAAETLFL